MKIIILSFQRQRKNRSEKAKREKEELAQEVERLKEQIALKGDSKFFMQKERKDKKFATCFSLHVFYCNAFSHCPQTFEGGGNPDSKFAEIASLERPAARRLH